MAGREQFIAQARNARAAGRHAEAAEAWRRAIALSPDEGVLYHNWAAALGDLRRHAEAAAALEAGFAKGLTAHQSYLVLARAKAGLLDHDAARAAYERYLASAPGDAVAQTELAQLVWMQTADAGLALQALDAAIGRSPPQADLIVARYRLIGEMGDREGAHAGLEALLLRAGPDVQVLAAASAAALACGKTGAAVAHAAKLVALQPADSTALSTQAMALIAAGAYREAQAAVERLRAIEPRNQYHIALQGDLWRHTGDARQQEVYDYDRLVFRTPLDAPQGWRSAEAYVDDLIAALEQRHCYRAEPFFQSVRQGSQISSLTSFEEPALRAFGDAIGGAAQRFAGRLAHASGPATLPGAPGAALVSSWSVLLPPGGFHADHVHPEGWISSACHLRCEDAEEVAGGGWLKFGQSPLPTTPPLPPAYLVRPQRGVVVFFPSYLWHGTIAARSSSRLTVAADFMPA